MKDEKLGTPQGPRHLHLYYIITPRPLPFHLLLIYYLFCMCVSAEYTCVYHVLFLPPHLFLGLSSSCQAWWYEPLLCWALSPACVSVS